MSILISFISVKSILTINPIPISLTILFISILVGILIFNNAMLSWLAFVFILTFASGIITLFVYVSSLTPNENINTNNSIAFSLLIIMLLSIPNSPSEIMNNSINIFSNQTAFIVIAVVILTSIVAISIQGYNPSHSASSNF